MVELLGYQRVFTEMLYVFLGRLYRMHWGFGEFPLDLKNVLQSYQNTHFPRDPSRCSPP